MGNFSVHNGGIDTDKTGLSNIDLRYGPYVNVAAAHAALAEKN